MGMSVGSRGGSGRPRRGSRRPIMSEINVTPFVDVVLVLLIVFMVAAPMLTVGVPIDLPQTSAAEMDVEREPVTVSVTPEGAIYVGEDQIALSDLTGLLAERQVSPDSRVYVRGDTTASYGVVMQVMGALSGAGYTRIGLITDQAPGGGGQ